MIIIIPKNSKIIYDTFIFFIDDEKKKLKIIKKLNELKFGTKNLPDAIEWHCASYWNHVLDSRQLRRSNKSLNLLKKELS